MTSKDPVRRALAEPIDIVPYDAGWPQRFKEETGRLRALLPSGSIGRIEHFGSTAVPGLAAKPIIDMLVEVPSLQDVHSRIAPVLQAHGYEYFWRPSAPGDPDIAYAWFIRRDQAGHRTHHIHMLSPASPDWDRLLFRDYLRNHPEVAATYARIKQDSAREHPDDRIAYAEAKGDFIRQITALARAAG